MRLMLRVLNYIYTWECTVPTGKARILNYIGVNSVEDYSAKVQQLGGSVKMPKMAVPGMGYLAVCSDSENNTFGLWENNTSAK
jgi:uncharacterized protein